MAYDSIPTGRSQKILDRPKTLFFLVDFSKKTLIRGEGTMPTVQPSDDHFEAERHDNHTHAVYFVLSRLP